VPKSKEMSNIELRISNVEGFHLGQEPGKGEGMREEATDWLIGANGIVAGRPGGSWKRLGDYRYSVNGILREADGSLTVGASNGLWQVPVDRSEMWVQLADETLTEVMALSHSLVGTVAGFPYGVAVSRIDEAGNPRWRSLTEHLRVNARFTNTILTDPDDPTRWIVGTEGGVIIGQGNGESWEESDLNDSPVRALIHTGDSFLAGTDLKGLMQSRDGCRWESVDGVDEATFAVAVAGDRIIAGSEHGVVVRASEGSRIRTGPRALVRCLGVDPNDPDIWVAGTDPGGLWFTVDAGQTWQNTGVVSRVRTIVVPEGGGRESGNL